MTKSLKLCAFLCTITLSFFATSTAGASLYEDGCHDANTVMDVNRSLDEDDKPTSGVDRVVEDRSADGTTYDDDGPETSEKRGKLGIVVHSLAAAATVYSATSSGNKYHIPINNIHSMMRGRNEDITAVYPDYPRPTQFQASPQNPQLNFFQPYPTQTSIPSFNPIYHREQSFVGPFRTQEYLGGNMHKKDPTGTQTTSADEWSQEDLIGE